MNAVDYVSDRQMLGQNIRALSALARQRVDEGWQPSLLTVTFAHVPGGPAAVIGRMGDAADRLYRIFVTKVVRRPASRKAVGVLPIFIGAPDEPVGKRTKPAGGVIALNGGKHWHAVILVSPGSRLRTSVEEHFRLCRRLYEQPPVDIVDVRPITHAPERALEYVLKSVRRGRFGWDDVQILPRALSELRAHKQS